MPRRPDPERTCVGCRNRAGKRALLRVVRTPEGTAAPDPSGKTPGRGAYVHPDPGCLEAAVKRGALVRALRLLTGLGAEEVASLRRAMEGATQA